MRRATRRDSIYGFSPVAGIQWVETVNRSRFDFLLFCFSPVAGIQWVETPRP